VVFLKTAADQYDCSAGAFEAQGGGGGSLGIRLRLSGTVKRLNVEHRTPNIERRILMTLRFVYFLTSEPQNIEYRTAACDEPFGPELTAEGFSRVECRRVESLCSVFFKIDRIHYFDIRHPLFDIRYSLFQRFFFN
jgi:hypothetical protein